MAKPSRVHIEGTVHQSIKTFLNHHSAQAESTTRKALGLNESDPLPVSGGEYPKALYLPAYFGAKNEYEREENVISVDSPEEEAEKSDYKPLPEAKKAFEDAKKAEQEQAKKK